MPSFDEIKLLLEQRAKVDVLASHLMSLGQNVLKLILPQVYETLLFCADTHYWPDTVAALVKAGLSFESFSLLFPKMIEQQDVANVVLLAEWVNRYLDKVDWCVLDKTQQKSLSQVVQQLMVLYITSIVEESYDQAKLLRIHILRILDEVLSKESQERYFEYEITEISINFKVDTKTQLIVFQTYGVVALTAWRDVFTASNPTPAAHAAMQRFLEPFIYRQALSIYESELGKLRARGSVQSNLFGFLPEFDNLASFHAAIRQYLSEQTSGRSSDKTARLGADTERFFNRFFADKTTFKARSGKDRSEVKANLLSHLRASRDLSDTAFESWQLYLLMDALRNSEKSALLADLIFSLLQAKDTPTLLKDSLKKLAEASGIKLLTDLVRAADISLAAVLAEFAEPPKPARPMRISKPSAIGRKPISSAAPPSEAASAAFTNQSKVTVARINAREAAQAKIAAERKSVLNTLKAATQEAVAGLYESAIAIKTQPDSSTRFKLLGLIYHYQLLLNARLDPVDQIADKALCDSLQPHYEVMAAQIAANPGSSWHTELMGMYPEGSAILNILIQWRRQFTESHAELKKLALPAVELEDLSNHLMRFPKIKIKPLLAEKLKAAKAQFDQGSAKLLPLIRQYYWDLNLLTGVEPRAKYRQTLLRGLFEQVRAVQTLIGELDAAEQKAPPEPSPFPGAPLAARVAHYQQLATLLDDLAWTWNEELNRYAMVLEALLRADPGLTSVRRLLEKLSGHYHQQLDEPALWQLVESFPAGKVRVFGTGIFYPGGEDWDVRIDALGSVTEILAQAEGNLGLPAPGGIQYHPYFPEMAPSGIKKVLEEVRVTIAAGRYYGNSLPLDLHFSAKHEDHELLTAPVALASPCVTIASGSVQVSHLAVAAMREGILDCVPFELNWPRKQDMPRDFMLTIRCLARFSENLTLTEDNAYCLRLGPTYRALINNLSAMLRENTPQADIVLQNLAWIWRKVSETRKAALADWYTRWGLAMSKDQKWQRLTPDLTAIHAQPAMLLSPSALSTRRSSGGSDNSGASANSSVSVASVTNAPASSASVTGGCVP